MAIGLVYVKRLTHYGSFVKPPCLTFRNCAYVHSVFVCVVCMVLRTNGDYFAIRYSMNGFITVEIFN